jgi:hypothetical protein
MDQEVAAEAAPVTLETMEVPELMENKGQPEGMGAAEEWEGC